MAKRVPTPQCEPQDEAAARILALACGDDPEETFTYSGSGTISIPLWADKYLKTIQRLRLLGFTLNLHYLQDGRH